MGDLSSIAENANARTARPSDTLTDHLELSRLLLSSIGFINFKKFVTRGRFWPTVHVSMFGQ